MTDFVPDRPTPDPAASGRPEDLAYLDPYILDIARRLVVADWTIITPREFCDDEAYAEIQFTRGKRVAIIRFCSWFRQRTLEEQRHTITHELIHIHLNAMEESFDALSPRLSSDVYQVAWSNFNRHLEEATDQLATVIAPILPLPPAPPALAPIT